MPAGISRRALPAILLLSMVWVDAHAQTISPIGSEARLEVATWNIEWFGSTGGGPTDETRQFANVRAVIEGSGVDLWAVQEVSNTVVFGALLDSLGDGYGGSLASISGTQRIGFVYRTDVIKPEQVRHILTDETYAFASRPPLELRAEVVLPDTSFMATFITVHMKCCADETSYTRKRSASVALKTLLDSEYEDDNLIVLGDFNDFVLESMTAGEQSPFTNFVADADDYRFVTQELELAGEFSWRGPLGGELTESMLDHILISDELFDAYQDGSSAVWRSLRTDVRFYASTTSDHYPVYATLNFSVGTSAETTDLPVARLQQPYPNPASGVVAIPFVLDRAEDVRLDVLDVTGRRIVRLNEGFAAAGEHRVEWDASSVAPGLYLISLTTASGRLTRTVAVVR